MGVSNPNIILCSHQLSGKCEIHPTLCDKGIRHDCIDGHAIPASAASASLPFVYTPNPDYSGCIMWGVASGAFPACDWLQILHHDDTYVISATDPLDPAACTIVLVVSHACLNSTT